LQYANAVGTVPDVLFGGWREQFGADRGEAVSAYAEDIAYHLMLICFMGVLDGNMDALRWLVVLMVRGGLNRQLTISRFLGVAIPDIIEGPAEMLPGHDAVLGWAEVASNASSLESVLARMVAEYRSRVQLS
jgi:hypothetical protein